MCKGRRKEGKGQLNRFTTVNRFVVESIQCSLNRFNPEVGCISYKYLGSVRKHNTYHNLAVFEAPNLSQVSSSILVFILIWFPPTLAYKDHLAAIGVKIVTTVQEEFIITSKEIRFEVVAVPDFLFYEEFSILVSLGFVLIICNSNKK